MTSSFYKELVVLVDLRNAQALLDHIWVYFSHFTGSFAEVLVFRRCLVSILVAARHLELRNPFFSAAASYLRK